MERIERKAFQGITNVVRFNWHYYIIALNVILALFIAKSFLFPDYRFVFSLIIIAIILGTSLSLFASWYIYDHSSLYTLNWMDSILFKQNAQLVTINAGFDETSEQLTQKYPTAHLHVFDFYDSSKHTEVSIERARKAYSVFPGTITIATNKIPLESNSTDGIFLILAAHEIRNEYEQIIFFNELDRVLVNEGKIIVLEHSRDIPNFIAYNFGFFHFFSQSHWRKIFTAAELKIEKEIKITPFITTYILKRNGNPS